MADEIEIDGVDEKCLELALHCLDDPQWSEERRIGLAHALQQTVMDYIETFGLR